MANLQVQQTMIILITEALSVRVTDALLSRIEDFCKQGAG